MHEDIPGQIILEGMETFDANQRFDPNQRRAFGSVPGLMGKDLDLLPRYRIGEAAFQRIEPHVLEGQLFGAEGGMSVKGLLLNADEYTLIVRSDKAFRTAVQARTAAANQHISVAEKYRKTAASANHAFSNKLAAYDGILQGFSGERERLSQLLEWQQTPGYARIDEANMRILANDAYGSSFMNIINTIADHRHLEQEERDKTFIALSHRLFKGPQREKMAYWGDMLQLALHYNRAKTTIFKQSQQRILRHTGALAVELGETETPKTN